MLIVDDDPDILLTARLVLKRVFSSISTESNPHLLPGRLQSERFDLLLLDMNFTTGFTSGNEGLRWLKKILKLHPQGKIVLMTAYGDIDLAVRAMQAGAQDFVVKPWDNDELIAKLRKVMEKPSQAASPPVPASVILGGAPSENDQIIGRSRPMQKLHEDIHKIAPSEANVLILGENGTGKELVAKILHTQSGRSQAPYVQVDLGAITESLFESEMFGHVKGAFTDARQDRQGRLEAANGGSLFLDEIGNLSLGMQAKLLTALQSRSIQAVGSNETRKLSFRLISATNRSLQEMTQTQSFRQDLLYRINTVSLHLPPLRERKGDIPLLLAHFIERYAQQYEKEPLRIQPALLARLDAYHWPGNVRELQHAVERAIIMDDPESLLPFTASPNDKSVPPKETEKDLLQRCLDRNQGNLSKTALEMGWSRNTLYRKMEKHGLQSPSKS
ncbi:MAG: sigma-54 dependent transcriptional regulator [Bacteroidota bacterium]